MSLVILILLTTFALPKLANIFQGGGFEPPLFSRIVFKVGLFINDNLWVMAGSFLLVLLVGVFSARTLAGRNFLNRMLLKAPIIKTIKFNLAIQRFATTLTSLLRAGVPILESLRITADTISHPDLTESLGRIADEGLAKGLTLGEAFRKEKVFPLVVTNLVAIAEKSGHLDEILDTLGKFYETEIDGSIKTAITFVEPIMLLGIGLVIGTIALAIIVPIYQLISQF
jgi:type II secretory pathway component PulF